MFFQSFVLCTLASAVLAAPAVERDAATPVVTITAPAATIVGKGGSTEEFLGIPFAQPPVGALRLKPPQALTSALGTIQATAQGKTCPQFYFSDAVDDAIPTSDLGLVLNTPLFQTLTNAGEDCLTINVYRPAGTTASSKLPVLYWIFGGGFEIGGISMYDGSGIVAESVLEGKPIMFVEVNYRVGGFGFLPGKEILADGSSNLGLLDQRLGLEWVADNIAAFGGDPSKVTIWGESAGSISVLDQMALYGGDNTYKGKPLFRGAIMDSGSIVPTDTVDCPKGQIVYDTVVESAGCSSSSDTLACLRSVPYETLLNATNSVPGLLSYTSVALSYLPRPDGVVLPQSPELSIKSGQFAHVPFIVGDQEDEGTLFALFQSNITTEAELLTYLKDIFFHDATTAQLQGLLDVYPNNIVDGSPFRTGLANNWYPQFKRLAAILGDLTFTLTRRAFLNEANTAAPTVPSWSYLSSYYYGTPILGTFHGTDVTPLELFSTTSGATQNYPEAVIRAYYLSFVNTLDPNDGTDSKYINWPQWSSSNELMNFLATSQQLITDDFRSAAYNYVNANIPSLRI